MNRFVEIRKAMGLVQDEAASALGVSKPTYILREKGAEDFFMLRDFEHILATHVKMESIPDFKFEDLGSTWVVKYDDKLVAFDLVELTNYYTFRGLALRHWNILLPSAKHRAAWLRYFMEHSNEKAKK